MSPLQVPEVEGHRQPLVAPAGYCEAHDWEDHRPLPTYCELHHVIPVAWQKFWWPSWNNGHERGQAAMAHVPTGNFAPKDVVWDARLVPLGPTCHRNVHFWLVHFMKLHDDKPVSQPVPRGGTAEKAIARLAMERWVGWGGDLDALCDAGLYGYA